MKREDCDHCFHDTGLQLTSDPPQNEKICCKCGIKIAIKQLPITDESEHGPYHPGNYIRSK